MIDIGSSRSGLRSSPPSIVEISVRYCPSPPGELGRNPGRHGKGHPARDVRIWPQSRRHLLIAYERAERHDGETHIEGLPKSTRREFSSKLSFVPAGHRFYGWQIPRVLTRVAYFYIDSQHTLFDPESGIGRYMISPRLFFFDQAVWNTALKLKAEVGNSGPSSGEYAEALGLVLIHELIRLERTTSVARPLRGGLPVWQ